MRVFCKDEICLVHNFQVKKDASNKAYPDDRVATSRRNVYSKTVHQRPAFRTPRYKMMESMI